MNLNEFREPLNNCQELFQVPKISIIQACRGGFNIHQGLIPDNPISNSAGNVIHEVSDNYLLFSAPDGNLSWRINTGSIFIQHLSNVFKRVGHNRSNETLTEIDLEVRARMQSEPLRQVVLADRLCRATFLSEAVTTLTRQLRFFHSQVRS